MRKQRARTKDALVVFALTLTLLSSLASATDNETCEPARKGICPFTTGNKTIAAESIPTVSEDVSESDMEITSSDIENITRDVNETLAYINNALDDFNRTLTELTARRTQTTARSGSKAPVTFLIALIVVFGMAVAAYASMHVKERGEKRI